MIKDYIVIDNALDDQCMLPIHELKYLVKNNHIGRLDTLFDITFNNGEDFSDNELEVLGRQELSRLSASLDTGALGLNIQSLSADSAAALLVYSQSGAGYLPLINGSVLTRSTVPTANIGVLNP